MSCGGSQPAGLCGLRKQVIEAKEGPWELRRKKRKGSLHGEMSRERGKAQACASGRDSTLGPLSSGPLSVLILGEIPREDPNRIFISFPGVSFQGCGLH